MVKFKLQDNGGRSLNKSYQSFIIYQVKQTRVFSLGKKIKEDHTSLYMWMMEESSVTVKMR
jgi:hypothetical protein